MKNKGKQTQKSFSATTGSKQTAVFAENRCVSRIVVFTIPP